MLTRIISGAVGVLILAVVLFFHDTMVLPIAVAAMIGIMLFELLRAVKLEKNLPILIASELCGISMPFIYNYFYRWHEEKKMDLTLAIADMDGAVTLVAFAVTLAGAFIIFVTWLRHHNEIRYEQVFFALAVMVLVPQAMSCIVRIHGCSPENGLFLLIMGLCGAWIADTGAYFSGVALGKHKLCPEISPKKTIEGFVGGVLITGIVFAAAFCVREGFSAKTAAVAFVTGAVCAVVGTIGDLSASMVKRQIGFKDYGNIMPGHGGMMDRFDSVLFVAPAFYALLELITIK